MGQCKARNIYTILNKSASRMPDTRTDFLSSKCLFRTWSNYALLLTIQCLRDCRSAIISPIDKQVIIHDGFITLRGWSYSGGGNWVERVEVSPDG